MIQLATLRAKLAVLVVIAFGLGARSQILAVATPSGAIAPVGYCGDGICQANECYDSQTHGDGCEEDATTCPANSITGRPPSCTPREDFGVVASVFSDANFTHATQTLGLGSVRLTASWSTIEPSNGNWQFAATTSDIKRAQGAGLNVYLSMGGGDHPNIYVPDWVHTACGSNMTCLMSYWYSFVFQVMSMYHGYNLTFGVLNEPDLDSSAQDLIFQNPSAYSRYVLEADYARNAVDPSIRLGVPETSDGAVNSGWLASALRDITLASQDVITVHWYDSSQDYPQLGQYMYAVDSVVGGREKWLTEVGSQTVNGYANFITAYVSYDTSFNFTRMMPYVLHSSEYQWTLTDSFWNVTPRYTEYESLIANYVCH